MTQNNLEFPDNSRPSVETLPAKIPCLKCQEDFNSTHRIKERICKTCKSYADWNDDSPLAPEGHGDAYEISDTVGIF